MKRIKFLTAIAIMASLTALSGNVLAQRGLGRGMYGPEERPRMGQCVLNLSEEQQTQIDALRAKHLNEVTPLRNELDEKRARLRTLQSANESDLNAINNNIDEMSTLRANIQKKGSAHRVEVSKLLTEEQRAVFNARGSRGMGRQGKAGFGGMNRGQRGFSN